MNCNVLIVESLVEAGGFLIANLPSFPVCNRKCVKFVITQHIPTTPEGNPLPILIGVGAVGFSMINRCGNRVYSDQLRTRTVYVVKLTTDSILAINQRPNLKCTSKAITCLPVVEDVPVDPSGPDEGEQIKRVVPVKESDKK